MRYKFILFISALLFTSSGFSQATSGGKAYELSFEGATFLPYGIPRVREILNGIDLRGTLPTSKGKFELDAFLANAEGVSYRSMAIDYRYDIGIDEFPAFALFGINADFYTPPSPYDTQKYSGGWHFGGGFLQPLTGGWSLREDFRYRFGPGTTLIVGVGFNFQFSN
jgi:hypothetical protein